jgi:agmatine/peptidylarginine deiminase
MIADSLANTVFIADSLVHHFPAVADGLRRILDDHGIALRTIRGTKDIWCRDYMPVQVGIGAFVRFRYEPDYLRGYEHLITRPGDIAAIPEIEGCTSSEIDLDGGNVVGHDSRCIVTDKIFCANRGVSRAEVMETLRGLLRIEELIVIPKEPYDVVGHSDGVVRFLDEGTVAINDYSRIDAAYRRRLTTVLRRSRLKWVEVPYCPREGRRGQLPPAFGNYVNFLRVRGLIVMPSYGITEDDEARRIIAEAAPGSIVRSLDCSGLSMEGGVLNCATWGLSPSGRPFADVGLHRQAPSRSRTMLSNKKP